MTDPREPLISLGEVASVAGTIVVGLVLLVVASTFAPDIWRLVDRWRARRRRRR